MRKALPGPFTFILNANNRVPRIFKTNKKTIGIRIPDNLIARTLSEKLGHPMVSASIHSEDHIVEYLTDPDEIEALFHNQADVIIDGGTGDMVPSTIIDVTGAEAEIVREGKGQLS